VQYLDDFVDWLLGSDFHQIKNIRIERFDEVGNAFQVLPPGIIEAVMLNLALRDAGRREEFRVESHNAERNGVVGSGGVAQTYAKDSGK
jgi:hypothetical protein